MLAPTGQFIVSTPNKLYYAESRGRPGANPFHAHEFEFDEFRDEFSAIFPHVSMFLENHVEGVAFQPDERRYGPPKYAWMAATARRPNRTFSWRSARTAPQTWQSDVRLCSRRGERAARAREAHRTARRRTAAQGRLAGDAKRELADLDREHRKLTAELEESNHWAASLNGEVASCGARIAELQAELAARAGQRARRTDRQDYRAKTEWAAVERAADAKLRNWRNASSICTRRNRPSRSARGWAQILTPRSSSFAVSSALPRIAMGAAGPPGRVGTDLPTCNDGPLAGPLPVAVGHPLLSLAIVDLAWLSSVRARRRGPPQPAGAPLPTAATVVIPNWNGRDLLEQYLPSVVAALAGNPENEILVVDNGSADGSAEFVRHRFPQVKVLRARPEPGLWRRLECRIPCGAERYRSAAEQRHAGGRPISWRRCSKASRRTVFAVSCQIFFRDPAKLREETGLTEGWWQDGGLNVRHRADPAIDRALPVLLRRRRILRLRPPQVPGTGRFRRTARRPSTWKTPTSATWRGSAAGRCCISRAASCITSIAAPSASASAKRRSKRCSKRTTCCSAGRISTMAPLAAHFFFAWRARCSAWRSATFPAAPLCRALARVPAASRRVSSRWRARSLAAVSTIPKLSAGRLGGYFRDRFAAMERDPERLRVLFVSPYPIFPPVHGGGVFMYQTLRALAPLAETHVIALLDAPSQARDNQELSGCHALGRESLARPAAEMAESGSRLPYAVREVALDDLDWLIHRQLYLKHIDVLQRSNDALLDSRTENHAESISIFAAGRRRWR